jgi:hypothetical protein
MAVTMLSDLGFTTLLVNQRLIPVCFVVIAIPTISDSFHFPLLIMFTQSGSPDLKIRTKISEVVQRSRGCGLPPAAKASDSDRGYIGASIKLFELLAPKFKKHLRTFISMIPTTRGETYRVFMI